MKGIKNIIVKATIFAVLTAVFFMGGAGRSIKTVRADDYCAQVVNGAKYTSVQAAIDAAGGEATVKLLKDVTLSSPLSIDKKKITLDLNGHTIDRGLGGGDAVENGYVIKLEASEYSESSSGLTLTDCSTGKTGLITGGNTTSHEPPALLVV